MGVSGEARTNATAALSNFGNPKHIFAFPLKTLSGKTRQSKPARKEDKMTIYHDVNRWHANKEPQLRDSGDTIHKHQWRVAMLLLHFWPNATVAEIVAAMTHDQAEPILGDMPYHAKRNFRKLGKAYKQAEHDLQVFRFYWGVTPDQKNKIKFCDLLDAFLWMLLHAPWVQSRTDWQDQRREIFDLAAKLEIEESDVDALIRVETMP